MIRIVQVGMGGWGRNWARTMLPLVPGIELVACADGAEDALEFTVEQAILASGRCYQVLEDAVAATAPEAALVTSDPSSHAELVRRSLEAGLHVLVEKPFALSVVEAAELVALADDLGRVLMVSQNYRFFPAVRAVRHLVSEQRFGELHGVDVEFRQYSPRLPSEPHHLLGEPLLVDMSVHHFDLLRAVLGADALEVSCRSWNPSWSWFVGPSEGAALISFDDKSTATYRASWLSQGRLTPWAGRWCMEFADAQVCWTSRGDTRDGIDGESVVIHRRQAKDEVLALDPLEFVDRAGCLAEFVAAVTEGREPESSGRENLGTIALMEAAVASARAASSPTPGSGVSAVEANAGIGTGEAVSVARLPYRSMGGA